MIKTFRTLILLTLSGLFAVQGFAQTSSGKSFYVDYAQWCTLGYPSIYINCGNDASFNTGNQLTMEVWARAYIFGENRKIMGKMSNTLNNGYVMGFENLNIYTEIMNPDAQVVPHAGTGPMPTDSAWVHIATTFDANGQMVNYLNGVNVGETTVFPQSPIAANTDPFIIGLAPWDLLSFEFVGNLDEVRIWNVARTAQQIKDDMFRMLKGNETGLVAYYNFNADTDSVVHDFASNTLNGILKNSQATCFTWAPSYAPVGDSAMSLKNGLAASWYGKDPDLYTYAITTNGLSLITSIPEKDFQKYVLFGHNNGVGKTNADAPPTAPLDFERMSRVWYVNQGGVFESQVVFNILDGAGGGATLTSAGADSLYTLLVRDDSTGNFMPMYAATTVMSNTVLFDKVTLQDKYYTLGYSSKRLAQTAAISETEGKKHTLIYPNPVKENLFVNVTDDSEITLFELSGKAVYNSFFKKGLQQIPVHSFSKGIYFIRIQTSANTETQKIVLQ
ncbi:MAG: LamG-like jellyroll fold domain-containing protein [Bacteroidota bacterium]